MDARKEAILQVIVDHYIHHAEPISSKLIVEKSGLTVSSATIRNDMAVLEREGFITQPHTSAGRVPTEKAYIYYLQHFVEKESLPQRTALREVMQEARDEDTMKSLAKALTELSGELAVVAFGENSSYYTGVGNLFAKPDFHDLAVVRSLSGLLDQFDDVVGELFNELADQPQVRIGSANPFGQEMSSIVVKYALPDGRVGLIGLIGPMRMNYARNIALLERAKELLDESYE